MIDNTVKAVKKYTSPYVTDPGCQYRPVYTPELMPDGSIDLVQTGVEDIQALIEADRDSCDINCLVKRFEDGDIDALRRGNPQFLDVVSAPRSLAEAYAINIRAENAFEHLPAVVKAKFGNSYGLFVQQAGTPEWYEALKIEQPVQPQTEKQKEGDA